MIAGGACMDRLLRQQRAGKRTGTATSVERVRREPGQDDLAGVTHA